MADTDTDTGTIDAGTDTVDQLAAITDEWTPPSKVDFEKLQRALAKANGEAKTHREKARELATKGEDDAGKAAREASEAAEKRYKPIAVRAAARAGFLEAGLAGGTPERVAKLTKLIDLDAVTIDDDGDVTGLDDQIAAVKADYPELFTVERTKPPRVAASNRPPANTTPRRSSDLLAAQVLGQ